MLIQHLLQFERVIYMGSGDPILTNNTIFFIRRSRRVRIFDPFRNLMTSKILDFPGYKGLTCNYRGLSYYDVIKEFPHAGLMRTFQISKKGVIYFRKNAKSRSTIFFPSWKLYWPHYMYEYPETNERFPAGRAGGISKPWNERRFDVPKIISPFISRRWKERETWWARWT